MKSNLTFAYQFSADPEDDFGWLAVAVTSDAFSGSGGFWVQWQDVKEFGEKLSTYPIPADAPVVAQWGFEMQEGDDLRLHIEIGPANAKGDLQVRAEVANYHEPTQRVRTTFLTHYSDVEAFGVAIGRLMEKQTDEAVLQGR